MVFVDWFIFSSKQGRLLGESTSLSGEPGIFHLVITLHHDGNLECVATLQNNTKRVGAAVSNTHYLKVVGECLYLYDVACIMCA